MVQRDSFCKTRTSQVKFSSYTFFSRRKFVIKRQLQYQLLALALAYALFFMVSVAALMVVPTVIQLNAMDPMSSEASHLADGLLFLHNHYWPTVILPLVLIALHSILTSHKIAGPLYRFSRVFSAIEQGRLPVPIQLRKRDYLKTEMTQINRMVGSLRNRIEEIKDAQEEMRESLATCQREIRSVIFEGQDQLLKDLELKEKQLEAKIAFFEIEG